MSFDIFKKMIEILIELINYLKQLFGLAPKETA